MRWMKAGYSRVKLRDFLPGFLALFIDAADLFLGGGVVGGLGLDLLGMGEGAGGEALFVVEFGEVDVAAVLFGSFAGIGAGREEAEGEEIEEANAHDFV